MVAPGWLLTSDAKRLAKLAAALGEMAKSLEARLLLAERNAAALRKSHSEIATAIEQGGMVSLTFRSTALRGLVEAGKAIAVCEGDAAALRRGLRLTRGKQTALSDRGECLQSSADRKSDEEESLETALAMHGKASGKHGVVK
jgi:hypothetical protein